MLSRRRLTFSKGGSRPLPCSHANMSRERRTHALYVCSILATENTLRMRKTQRRTLLNKRRSRSRLQTVTRLELPSLGKATLYLLRLRVHSSQSVVSNTKRFRSHAVTEFKEDLRGLWRQISAEASPSLASVSAHNVGPCSHRALRKEQSTHS